MINKLKVMLVLLLGVLGIFACNDTKQPKQQETPPPKKQNASDNKSNQEKMYSSLVNEVEQEEIFFDSSWYIHSGLHLQGNNYASLTPATSNKVTIYGISLPDKNCETKAKDDIFIIYQDGTYYSSREDNFATTKDTQPLTIIGPEYLTLNGDKKRSRVRSYDEDEKKYGEKTTPIFSSSYMPDINRPTRRPNLIPYEKTYLSYKSDSDTIIFLYATNPYDDDPPPGRINTTNTVEVVYNTITKTNIKNVLSANHNITIGNDITIIINSSGLDSNGYIPPYKLKYYEVGTPESRIIPIGGDLFSPSPIFFDNPAFPLGENSIGGAESTIKSFHPSSGYAYINLRPKNFPAELLPSFDENGNSIVKSIIFQLFDGNDTLISNLVETIGHSNDPNIIKATKICKNASGQESVQYYCTFQNVFRVAAKNLKVRFRLPAGLIRASLVISDSYANGIEIPNPEIPPLSDNYIEIKWPSTLQINACANDSGFGIIRFNFCVKKDMNSNLDLTEAMALEVTNAFTSFTTNGKTMEYPLVYQDLPCTLESKFYPELNAKIGINCNRKFQNCDCN